MKGEELGKLLLDGLLVAKDCHLVCMTVHMSTLSASIS